MALSEFFPVWDQLTADEQALLSQSAVWRFAPRGTLLHNGSTDCQGLLVLHTGQLRAFILSDEGKEITIYRLFERDVCLFSAACLMNTMLLDLSIEAEKDAQLWVIPTEVYKSLMARNVAVANYTNQIMASRFSEVMWLVEQIMWKRFDQRLAGFLLEESMLEASATLKLTHDRIAGHLGTAREVVTRMLRYFQIEGMVRVTRGTVELIDKEKLRAVVRSEKAGD